jgi:hypothetical protein
MALSISLMAAIVLGTSLLMHTPDQAADTARWMRVLSLSAPALMPSGSPGRHPETVHPAIDLRHAAGLVEGP